MIKYTRRAILLLLLIIPIGMIIVGLFQPLPSPGLEYAFTVIALPIIVLVYWEFAYHPWG